MTRILRLPETIHRTGFSRSSIYAKMKDGLFPKPINISDRAVGWLESEIDQHIADLVQASRGGANE